MLSKSILKYIQSLHHKKFRQQDSVFIAEGPKVVKDLLMSGKFSCKIICAYKDWIVENEILITKSNCENVISISELELNKISLLETPNNVLAVFQEGATQEFVLEKKISLMLDGIKDPGNMGTIIRTADWFGVETIICSEDCVDCYNPKAVQSTMGSLGRVNITYTGLSQFLNDNRNIDVYAATLNGDNLSSFNNVSEAIILIGSESKGVNNDLLTLVTRQVTIKKTGMAESLNAAVATGIILSHLIK